jgi:2-polyprenyl-3-methyl-5-hydroxy-6-metoxy-1,4-benzoquinol methylase
MKQFRESIENIAERYHGSLQSDIHIENICQLFEIEWLKKVIPNNSVVIDMGYGDGLISPAISGICKLTVVEGSKRLCEKASTELPISSKIVCSLFEDFVPEALADVVIASHVLEHVQDPYDILKKISKWLKKDGIIIIIVPNKESIHRRIAHDMNIIDSLDQLSERDFMVGHKRVYGLQELILELESADFEIKSHRGFFVKPFSNAQMLTWNSEALIMLNELSEVVPSHFCANLAVIAKLGTSV